MGTQFLYPTFASGGLDTTYQCTPPWDDTALYRANFNWQRRGPAAKFDRIGWCHLWPRSSFMSGDPTSPMAIFGQDVMNSNADFFEPPTCMGDGCASQKFFLGSTLDSGGSPLPSATVEGFVTATDISIGSVQSAVDATYVLPTNTPAGTQHYLVARKAGSPNVAGASDNTLTPTNIDGT